MRRILLSLAVISCFSFAVQATTGALGTLGWTTSDIQRAVQDPLRSGMSYSPLWLIKTSTRQTLRAMNEESRANFLRELLPVVKSVILSPEYQTIHENYIRTSHQAVNHGVQVQSQPEAAEDVLSQMQALQQQVAAQMALAMRQMPIEGIKMLYAQDLENWKQQANDEENSDRAKFQKLVARARKAEPLLTSNPEEFKKEFSRMKSIEAGGSGDDAAINAASDDGKKQREQQAWNEYNLKNLLKRRLSEFVEVASTVDFTAQTTGEGRNRKFVDVQHERKPSEWKTLYRLGKAPTMAALDFARQWLKELS
jgi:hypothetical protein